MELPIITIPAKKQCVFYVVAEERGPEVLDILNDKVNEKER